MNRFLGGLWLIAFGCALGIGACAPTSSEVGRMKDPDAGIADGGEMPDGPTPNGNGGTGGGSSAACKEGEVKPAADGCNTCACDDGGQWACTQIACGCKSGETRVGDDGCAKCVCENGNWSCDERGCSACTVGERSMSGCLSCVCADHGEGPIWDCSSDGCPQCKPGDTRVSDDMCSTCMCGMDGAWRCPEAGTGCGTACAEGAMMASGDGCNSCTCFHGSWACTLIACQTPLACEPGLGDCDADPANGCETKLAADANNCGGCGLVCNFAGGAGSCQAGLCVLTACTSGYADCDLDPSNGCEVPVGPEGCKQRCDYPEDSPEIVPATGDCKCPTGMTCVRNTVPDKGAFCYPAPNGCGTRAPDCACLGSCVCPEGNAGATCSEQMAVGGFIIDCFGIK